MEPFPAKGGSNRQRRGSSVTGTGTGVPPEVVRQARRWLRFAASTGRPAPALVTEALGCATYPEARHAFHRAVVVAVDTGAMTMADARAWASSAGLNGERVTLEDQARTWGLTTARGFAKRLARLDIELSRFVGTDVSTLAPPADVPALVTHAARLLIDGKVDEADGVLQAAATLGGETQRIALVGRARVRRLRARRAILVARRPVDAPPLREAVVVCPFSLHDDPGAAISALDQAWQDGRVDLIPLLMERALRAAPTVAAVGADQRLWLLETIGNIVRDAEVLEGVHWTTKWLLEASRFAPRESIQPLKARRTRAHLLQLHGFVSTAQRELERCWHELHVLNRNHPEFGLERAEVLNRLLTATLAEGNLARVSDELRRHDASDPGLFRVRLHLSSLMAEAAHREGRSHRRSPLTSSLLDTGFAQLGALAGFRYHAMLDTLLAAAIRVGDQYALAHVMEQVQPVAPRWGNLDSRLRIHLAIARSRMPHSTVDVLAMGSPPEHPLRTAGRVATNPQHAL